MAIIHNKVKKFGGIGGRPIIQAYPAKAISQNRMECPPKRSSYYDKKNRQKRYTLSAEENTKSSTYSFPCPYTIVGLINPGGGCALHSENKKALAPTIVRA
jgi:hypothetical protein